MIGTFEQGQGVFPIQQWRFGLYDFSLKIPVEDIFEKVWCQLFRSLGSIQIVDLHNYLLMTIEGQLMRGLFECKRQKPAMLHMDKGNVRTLSELKKVMNLEITV